MKNDECYDFKKLTSIFYNYGDSMLRTNVGEFSKNGNFKSQSDIKEIKYLYKKEKSTIEDNEYLYILEGEFQINKNIGKERKFYIHYCGTDKDWYDKECFLKSSNNSTEIWCFYLETKIYKFTHDKFYEFVIKYDIDGVEFWDSNQEKNYDPNME